jgi:hypothetical protein
MLYNVAKELNVHQKPHQSWINKTAKIFCNVFTLSKTIKHLAQYGEVFLAVPVQ